MERTPTFTPDVHLAFMRNSISGEMFIAPALGAGLAQAESALREAYPSAAYTLLALYPAQEVQRYLIELNRWPGMPSKVQPKLADLLASQRIRTQTGGLPPLRREAPQPAAAGLNSAQLAQIQTIAKGMPSEVRDMAARLLSPTVTETPTVTAAPTPHPFAPRPTAQPAVPQNSLKDALAAMRAMNSQTTSQSAALSAKIEQTTTPAKHDMPNAGVISRTPIPAQPMASGQLSASALPPSARGTMQEDATPSPEAFAVGKVSAISVLKALRGH